MFVIVVFLLTVQQVLSSCVPSLCTNTTAVQNEIVDLHNQLRRSVQPPAQDMLEMSWSDEIAAPLQTWVDGCVLAHGKPSTRLLNGYELGENLFYTSSPASWTSVIQTWFNEVQDFKYPDGSTNGKETGHYTQVVWNSSYKVGCAMAKCTNFKSTIYFYGCRYYRAGNFKTWHPYTEGKPCGMCPNNCVNKLCTNPCPYINHFLNCGALRSYIGSCNAFVTKNCPALCKCPTEIIPINK